MKSLNLSDFIVAIILGMVICNTVGVHAVFRDGLRFSTTLTKTGIVVMGCKYSFAGLIKTGSEAIIISLFLFTSAIILMWLSRRLSMSPSLGACLAAGLSICGVSACVAIAPAVRAKNEDIAYTIAVVLMFGLLALLIFPFIGHWLDLRACLETSAFIVTRRHVDKKGLCAAAKTREDCQTIPQRSDGQRMGACTSSPAPCFRRRSEAQNRPA